MAAESGAHRLNTFDEALAAIKLGNFVIVVVCATLQLNVRNELISAHCSADVAMLFCKMLNASAPVKGFSNAVQRAQLRFTAAILEFHGHALIAQDDASRENEGDFIMPAELATGDAVALMLRHCTGLVCTAMPPKTYVASPCVHDEISPARPQYAGAKSLGCR